MDHMPVPWVVENVIHHVGGYQDSLFAEKILTDSDVSRHQNRLRIPQGYVNDIILPQLNQGERNMLLAGLELKLYTSPGWEFTIILSCHQTDGSMVLRGSHWIMVLHTANLQPGDKVQVWSFRSAPDNELCLVIAKINAA